MQKIKLKTEESGKKLLEAYAPPKWSKTADDDDTIYVHCAFIHDVTDIFTNLYPLPQFV